MKLGMGLLAIVLIVGGVWFLLDSQGETQPSGQNVAEEDGEGADTEPQKLQLDPAKYSFDLSGVERIVVEYEDRSTSEAEPLEQKTITDPERVGEIVQLLSELPTEGDLELETSPGLVTTIAGFRGDELVGYVEFRRTLLRAENGNYYAEVPNEVGQRESRLYSIVAELR